MELAGQWRRSLEREDAMVAYPTPFLGRRRKNISVASVAIVTTIWSTVATGQPNSSVGTYTTQTALASPKQQSATLTTSIEATLVATSKTTTTQELASGMQSGNGYSSQASVKDTLASDGMEKVASRYGFCTPPTPADCVDPAYWDSFCGKQEAEENSGSPGWVCTSPIAQDINAEHNSPNVSHKIVPVPWRMRSHAGETEHHLETDLVASSEPQNMPMIAIDPDTGATSPVVTGDYVAKGGNDPAEEIGLSQPERDRRTTWRTNGTQVTSCEEYAYEKFLDASRLIDHARAHPQDGRAVFRAVFEGFPGESPLAVQNGLTYTLQLKDSMGRPLPDKHHWMMSTAGFRNRWTPPDEVNSDVPTGGPLGRDEPDSSEYRAPTDEDGRNNDDSLGNWTPQNSSDSTYGQPDNGYLDLDRLSDWHFRTQNIFRYVSMSDAFIPNSSGGVFSGRRTEIRGFVPVRIWKHALLDVTWHKYMSDGTNGFLDEQLELAYDLGSQLWDLATEYDRLVAKSNKTTQERAQMDDLHAKMAELLVEGDKLGCSSNSTWTACDWAPSAFSEALIAFYGGNRQKVQERCEARFGAADFFDGQAFLNEWFFDPAPIFGGSSNEQLLAMAQQLRTTARANAGTHDLDAFESLWEQRQQYANEILDLIEVEGDEGSPFRQSEQEEHEYGKRGLISMAFIKRSNAGLRVAQADPPGEMSPPSEAVPPPPEDQSMEADTAAETVQKCANTLDNETHIKAELRLFSKEITMFERSTSTKTRPKSIFEESEGTSRDFEHSMGATVEGRPYYQPCTGPGGKPATCMGARIDLKVAYKLALSWEWWSQFQIAGPFWAVLTIGAGGGAEASIGIKAEIEQVQMGGSATDECPDPIRERIELTATPSLEIEGHASAGVAVGGPGLAVEVGVKLVAILVRLSAPLVYSTTYTNTTSEWEHTKTASIVLDFFNVLIKGYVAVIAGPFRFPAEVTLVDIKGPKKVWSTDEQIHQNWCAVARVRTIVSAEPEPGGCTCAGRSDGECSGS